jgi:hypothetical protein
MYFKCLKEEIQFISLGLQAFEHINQGKGGGERSKITIYDIKFGNIL